MEDDCIVVESGMSGDLAEVEVDEDGSVSIETLRCHFGPTVDALKYINPTTGLVRLLRVKDGKFLPPKGGWSDRTYTVSSRGGSDTNFTRTPTSPSDFTPESSRWQGESVDTTPSRFRRQLIKQEFGVGADNVGKLLREQEPGKTVAEAQLQELTKKALHSRMATSAVARTAVFQWNKLNTAVRILVHQTKFHGTGGMLACNGTTKEEAMENQRLRETIVQHDSVLRLFTTFCLEDGSGRCTIDVQKAFEHVRHVLNDMRRHGSKQGKSYEVPAHVDADADLEAEEDLVVEHRHTQENPDIQTKPLTRRNNSRTRGKNSKKRAAKDSADNENAPAKKPREEYTDNTEDNRSEYERSIDARRHENREKMYELGLIGKLSLMESDAVIVGRSLFPVGKRITLADIQEECEEYGLEPPPSAAKLRQALVHLGNELVNNDCVKINKPAGITRADVIKL